MDPCYLGRVPLQDASLSSSVRPHKMGKKDMKTRDCEKCGAPLEKNKLQCTYCGTWYEGNKSGISGRSRPVEVKSILNLPKGVGEFGISSNLFFVMGVTVTIVLYVLGWFFEDQQFWLNETAMLIWVGIIPIFLFGVALLWRVTRKVMLYGLAISLMVFLMHVFVIWVIRGDLWDDHVGIAAIVAGSSLAGWLLGRLGHGMIRWRNTKVQ